MYKTISCVCAALALCSYMSPCPVSADVVDESYVGGVNTLYRDMLQDTLAHYGLAETSLDGTDWYYCAGPYMDSTGNKSGQYCSALWIGGTAYRSVYYGSASIPYSDYYTGGYPCDIVGSYVGYPYLASFYFSVRGGHYYLDTFMTDNVDAFNRVDAATTEECFFADVSKASQIVIAYEDAVLPDPTEPTSSGSDGFQLPDGWVDGGETLPEAQISTFEGVNQEEALQQFETLVSDFDSVTTDASFLGSVGIFWAIITDFIDTLDVWIFVLLLMVFGLIAWFLGR